MLDKSTREFFEKLLLDSPDQARDLGLQIDIRCRGGQPPPMTHCNGQTLQRWVSWMDSMLTADPLKGADDLKTISSFLLGNPWVLDPELSQLLQLDALRNVELSHKSWIEARQKMAFIVYQRLKRPICTDDLQEFAKKHNIPQPPHHNAWGPVLTRHTGWRMVGTTESNRPERKKGLIRLWEPINP